ncbi:hypothetical protein A3842_28775 [Paenibacillus sp. P3E]|uniref:hypothetical protein n=1 Tax=Paenibacillus sp. P3E TaxID=1349435 RepID=UPI00093BD6D6|nr:hypothetical protein [Paenibacillus sp. P3E]OKP66948.1 hypothetical protein A3842_28775 [Paenibacillus sp. P3E]
MLTAIFILFYLYALLHLVTGFVQLKSKRIPVKNAVFFITGGLVILLTPSHQAIRLAPTLYLQKNLPVRCSGGTGTGRESANPGIVSYNETTLDD